MTGKPAKSAAAATHGDESLHGRVVDASDPAALRAAVELAVNYRGDVTIRRRSGGEPIEGYVFDCTTRRETGAVLRLVPKDSDDRVAVPLADIAQLAFSGKDTASGKSFESWIRKYAQKKRAGEAASIESEPLDASD